MQSFEYLFSGKKTILALGAESAGNFSVFHNGKIYFSKNFGDLLEDANWLAFQRAVLAFLKNNSAKPDIIITDLHPHMKTTLWCKALAKKYKAEHMQVQHHHAHIFSAIGEYWLKTTNYQLKTAFGIAMDGTGYGTDEKIWGGECFAISNFQFPISNQFSNPNNKASKQNLHMERIGHLENQILLGGELAIREPARMVISILSKFLSKKEVFTFVKKYYSRIEFDLLCSQLQQNFNCLETSSTGRILDAVSLLLDFCKNKRTYKHEAIELLEKNSTTPYTDLRPELIIKNSTFTQNSKFEIRNSLSTNYELKTTNLFQYLIKNLHKDKARLAATAQLYLAEGLYEIILKRHETQGMRQEQFIFAGGGITNNRIISEYFESKNIFLNKNIPRGDAGLSFGQIFWILFNK